MSQLHHFVVDVHIHEQELLKLYRGSAQTVQARSRDGRNVQFPAHILRPFVLADGVHGVFKITFDQHFKFHSIERLP